MFPHNNEGYHELVSTYDTECMQEIANHGCTSGVCHKHIYYVDTIAFFNKYEGEILDLIHIRYGTDELVKMFEKSEACYDMYRNECTWCFIENVAQDHIMELEQMEADQDATIEQYMSTDGYNHPSTMTDARYALS